IQKEDYYLFGTYFGEYFDTTILLYNFAIFTYGLSYFGAFRITKYRKYPIVKNWILRKRYWVYLLSFFVAVTYVISRKAGISPEGSNGGGFFTYLTFMSDSLIIAFLILLTGKKMRPWHLILLLITVVYYLVLGFRYRIIILLVGVLYHYFVVNRITPSSVLKWTVRIVMAFFIINFISLNRQAFRQLDFENVELSSETPNELTPYQYVMEQTGNYKTDMMVNKYINDNYLLGYDYGESMFYLLLVRIIPAKYF